MTHDPGDAAPQSHLHPPLVSERGQYAPGSAPSMHSRPAGPLHLDLDIDQALDELRRSFPDICIWYGEWSRSLWALLPDRLVEARTAADLASRLRSLRPHLRPDFATGRPTPSTRRPDGTWTVPPAPPRKPIRRDVAACRQRRSVARLLVGCLRLAGLSAWSRTPAW